MTDDLQPVREDHTGNFGIYHPDEHIIETYIGDDRHDIHGDYLGANWHPVEQDELAESIEADIAEIREAIDDVRDGGLTDEQERELERLESRLASYERALEIDREVRGEASDG